MKCARWAAVRGEKKKKTWYSMGTWWVVKLELADEQVGKWIPPRPENRWNGERGKRVERAE